MVKYSSACAQESCNRNNIIMLARSTVSLDSLVNDVFLSVHTTSRSLHQSLNARALYRLAGNETGVNVVPNLIFNRSYCTNAGAMVVVIESFDVDYFPCNKCERGEPDR